MLIESKVKDEDAFKSAKAKRLKNGGANSVSVTLLCIGWLTIILSVIALVKLSDTALYPASLVSVFGIITGIFIIGFAEIISLLHGIYHNTKK